MFNFNLEQQKIIDNIFGAYLVNAPVGTGKTTVLTERIVKALELGIRPDEILALTFTNRAADEMKNRIKNRIEDKNIFDALTISTFHGFCAYFLKSESEAASLSSDFLILDEEEQKELAKNILENNKKIYFSDEKKVLGFLDEIYKYRLSLLQIEMGHNIKLKNISPDLIVFGEEYRRQMLKQNSLDFNELVFLTLKILSSNQTVANRWSDRFRFIQLDEFQDTHISEYLVIKELAKKHKNITLIGDIDQTIYSFRDSQPVFISKLFKDHFKPVKEFDLTINYRSNPNLIKAFMSVLNNMENPKTKEMTAGDTNDKVEKNIKVFRAYNFSEEVLWIIDNIKKIREENSNAKIAVLTRTNNLIEKVADVFSNNNISFLTVDQYGFFKRQEVKDIFAYLKILFNKSDLLSAKRLIERPAKNIGEETLEKINSDGRACGLNLSDFLNFKNYNFLEPFNQLLISSHQGRIVVLDTETTGINPLNDEIVQIYAREIINGQLGEEFHFYLKNTKSVGSSYFVHKLSDDFLKDNGQDPKKILTALKKFIADSPVAGHNVMFDLNMIIENAKRYNLNFTFKTYYDTLDLARRLLDLDNYKLSTIAQKLNFKTATHSADDDVAATIDLLLYSIDKLKQTTEQRIALWNKFKTKFITISSAINNWEKQIDKLRPTEFLDYLWLESGLKDYYEKDKNANQRFKSINTLKMFFDDKDDITLSPRNSLYNLIRFSSLAKNIDFLGLEQGRIPIVTIHQVKGLEFDYVFLVGLNEGLFPFFRSDNEEEEKRLFYVALTRAKQQVFLSYSNFEYRDRERVMSKSRLLNLIDPKFVEEI